MKSGAPQGVRLEHAFGRNAGNRLEAAARPGMDGALAALETFYHAFNQRNDALLASLWADGPQVQLNNPLGGILRGIGPIAELYGRVFHGPARVWVAFSDIVVYDGGGSSPLPGARTASLA